LHRSLPSSKNYEVIFKVEEWSMKTGEASEEGFTGCISNYDMVEIGGFDL
jgi:hypothetical protein